MSDPDTFALLIDNVADLEAAIEVMTTLDSDILEGLGRATERWATDAQWLCGTDLENEDFYVAPAGWRQGEEWRAWFELEWDDSQGEDWFYATGLTGQGRGAPRFLLKQEALKLPAWRRLVAQHGELLRGTALLVSEKGEVSLPFRVGAAELATALRDDGSPDAALATLALALDQLRAAEPAVEDLLRLAEQQGV